MERMVNRDETRGFRPPARTAAGPILVATDGSPASAASLEVARRLADRSGAPVEIVSALEPLNVIVPPIDRPSPARLAGASRVDERRAQIDDLVRQTFGTPVDWPTVIVLGDRVPSLARAATERRAQLVVTAHTHHGALERAMRGETPLGIAREARVPVLAVPATMHALPRCVVVAVGLGDAGVRVGALAYSLFGDAIAIHLVHVRAPALPRHDREVREEDAVEESAGERAFERAQSSWSLPADVAVATHEVTGRPADALLTFAESVDADVVVAGLAPERGMPHLPHRSFAPRLYRAWRRAMLIVPVGDADAPRQLDPRITVSTDELQWPELLDRLARRNVGRSVSLVVDDRVGGAQIVARHRPLAALEYDPHARAAVVRLGDGARASWHLTHRVARPVAIAVHRLPSGADEALVVGYEGGQAMISFE